MELLRIEHISKAFPGVKALSDVSLTVHRGEVHALCGENGAGKSTLMNILTGNIQPDEGSIFLKGEKVTISSPGDAFSKGISIVYQHLSLVENLSVAENIYFNQQPVDKYGFIQFSKLKELTSALLAKLKIQIGPRTLLRDLSPSQKQMVEIAKAIVKEPDLLILDEPTASLTDRERDQLFSIIHDMISKGSSVIYISHRLSEIEEIANSVSILKDGRYVGTYQKAELTREELIAKMVGRDLLAVPRSTSREDNVLLEVKNLSSALFKNISFQLYEGEILGLAGLAGAGRTEIARAIFGMLPCEGNIFIRNEPVTLNHARDAVKRGIAYVPEDRKTLGLFMDMSVKENIVSAHNEMVGKSGFDDAEAVRVSKEYKEKLKISTPDVLQKVLYLSGGNQQKVILARWLLTKPEILIVDEPTHGIDVGTKYDIYGILRSIAAQKRGVLIISSELPELMSLCDRVIVLRSGEISGILDADELTEEKIMALATK